MSLDQIAAQAVMRARQIERAVHDRGPWSVRVGHASYPARRVVGPDHVTFYAIVRADRPELMELCCGDDVVAVREVDPVGRAQIAWEFATAMAEL